MAGIIKAIAWLEQMGRPILAAKMERELLYTFRDNKRSLDHHNSVCSSSS